MSDNEIQPEAEVDSIAPLGRLGVRRDTSGHAYIGQMPEMRRVPTEENALGLPAKFRHIIDMNPTIISYDGLLEVLAEQNRTGHQTILVGHIVVRPSSPERFTIIMVPKPAQDG